MSVLAADPVQDDVLALKRRQLSLLREKLALVK